MFWNKGFGGTFSTAANWDGGIPLINPPPPDGNDVAHFGVTVPATPPAVTFPRIYTVLFTTFETTNQALVVEDDVVTFNLNGNFYTTTSPNAAITVGTSSSSSGHLTITNGIVIADLSHVYLGVSGLGALTVTTNGFLIGSPEIVVGSGAAAALTINNSGDVIAGDVFINAPAGRTAAAMITGNGSVLGAADVIVGDSAVGTLNVMAGGDVDSTSGVIGNFAGSVGTTTVDGTGSRWRDSGDLFVGNNGSGTLNITTGGRVESSFATIGRFAGSMGTAKVEGAASTWNVDFDLQVGNEEGTGSLTIKDRGRVESMTGSIGDDGGMGTANVEGLNSTWVISGRLSVAGGGPSEPNLKITDGGYVENTDGFIGDAEGTGIATVDGDGSQWKNLGALSVGASGQGTLNITNGGLVLSASAKVGDGSFSPGTVIVDGPGSRWINSGDLILGDDSDGDLTITNGGLVLNDAGIVGSDSSATVEVSGPNSLWINSGMLRVGPSAPGTLNILDGGTVSCEDGAVGTSPLVTGTVTVAGANSLWAIFGRLDIGGDSSIPSNGGTGTLRIQPGGTVNVTEGTHLWDDDFLFLEGGTLSTSAIRRMGPIGFDRFFWTSGTLHVGFFEGSSLTVPNGGVLAPGNSIGTTTTQFDYASLLGATTEIEIRGTQQGVGHDFVNVLNNALLVSGDLHLVLIDGFVPSGANTFTILQTAGSVTGSYANVANGQRLATSGALGSFVVNYGPKNIVLSNFALSLPGDVNFDGVVDVFDINLVSAHWAESGPTADANGDMMVDIFDINLISSNWTGGAVPVPEPSCLVLASIAVFGLIVRVRRTRPR